MGRIIGKPFEKGNPGKAKGTVTKRKLIQQKLNEFLQDEENQRVIMAKWRDEMQKNFLQWWRFVVQPNLPKNFQLDIAGMFEVDSDEARERDELITKLLKEILAKGNGKAQLDEARAALRSGRLPGREARTSQP